MSAWHTSQRSRSADAPRNPHRQQRGGNSVAASARDRAFGPVNRQRLSWLTMPSVVPNMPRSFRRAGLAHQPEKRCKSINKGMGMEPIRHDWTVAEVEALFALPFADLMFRAQS